MTKCEVIENQITALMKPCPFCGFEAGLVGSKSGGLKASCLNQDCGCSLPSWLPFEEDANAIEKIAMAIEYWNERKEAR